MDIFNTQQMSVIEAGLYYDNRTGRLIILRFIPNGVLSLFTISIRSNPDVKPYSSIEELKNNVTDVTLELIDKDIESFKLDIKHVLTHDDRDELLGIIKKSFLENEQYLCMARLVKIIKELNIIK